MDKASPTSVVLGLSAASMVRRLGRSRVRESQGKLVLLLGVAGQGKVQGLCMQLHLRIGMATVCSAGSSGAALHS
jgi:hypothetical protein